MRKIWQILYNTGKSFFDDGCNSKAAALTYFTLMSIVPVLAVFLGLARGFGFSKILEETIRNQLSEQPEVAKYMIDFAYSLLERTSSGVIAGVGVIVLLWSVYNIFGTVEEALNYIWKVPTSRSLIRKMTDYVTAIVICPLFFVISSSLTIYLKTYVSELPGSKYLENAYIYLFPFILSWLLFAFLYFFLPNRRIPFKYGILGVLAGGTAYQLLQIFYISVQFKLTSYGAVYGSFAALPLFLIWLDLSWMIILGGAELAYQVEVASWHVAPPHRDFEHVQSTSRVLALMITNLCIRAFHDGKEAPTISDFSNKLGASKKDIEETLEILTKYKILSQTAYHSSRMTRYQPARDVNTITLKNIMDLIPPTEPMNPINLYKNSHVSYYEQTISNYEMKISREPENFLLVSALDFPSHEIKD